VSPATTDVLVVVDPTAPGAATAHLPSGDVLAELVSARATADGGRAAGRLEAGTLTAAADQLCAVLRASTSAPLALVDGSLVASGTLYGDVVAEPDGLGRVLRDDAGRVLALRLPAQARAELAAAVQLAATGWVPHRLLDGVADVAADHHLQLRDVQPGPFTAALASTVQEAMDTLAAVDALDEPALRLRRSSRADDGFLSTFLVRPPSRVVTRWALHLGLSAAAVTGLALALGLLAALAYALGSTAWLGVGSVLLLVSLVVDCVDGQVARYTRTTSALGGWLDVGADRVKEYAVYGGLALGVAGAARSEWMLALANLALLVTRHFVDFGFAARRTGGPGDEGAVGAWSARTDANPVIRYAKRAVIAPVGERTILLAVLAPLVGVRPALAVLLAYGVLAALWTTGGRLARALAARVAPTEQARALLAVQVDGRPLPLHGWRTGGPLGWLLPAFSRAFEQGGSIVLVDWLAPAALPSLFAWLAVIAVGEYDLTYRGRLTGVTESNGPLSQLGWPVRLALLLVVVALAPARAPALLGIGAALLGLGVAAACWAFWRRWIPSTP
jgi:phosphatidylglycerophosphate synthase